MLDFQITAKLIRTIGIWFYQMLVNKLFGFLIWSLLELVIGNILANSYLFFFCQPFVVLSLLKEVFFNFSILLRTLRN